MPDPKPDITLTKRNPNNWPERLIFLEGAFAEISQNHKEMQEQSRYALISLAESNERLASHMEESKRAHQRMDNQEEMIEELRKGQIEQEKLLISILEKNKQLLDFNLTLKRGAWTVMTGGVVVIFWLFQRWFEKHGGF